MEVVSGGGNVYYAALLFFRVVIAAIIAAEFATGMGIDPVEHFRYISSRDFYSVGDRRLKMGIDRSGVWDF